MFLISLEQIDSSLRRYFLFSLVQISETFRRVVTIFSNNWKSYLTTTMPKKGADRRKGRRNRNIGGPSNNGATPNTNVKTSPQQTRGRNTKNSRQGRNNPPRSSSAAVHTHTKKPSSLRGGSRKGRSNASPDQPIYFTSPDGELYKPGGE